MSANDENGNSTKVSHEIEVNNHNNDRIDVEGNTSARPTPEVNGQSSMIDIINS